VEVVAKEDKGKVKMTVIHFETESDNATLQANIHAIAQTLTRALAPAPRVPRAPTQLTSGNGAGEEDLGQVIELDDYEDAFDSDLTAAPAKPKKSGAARQYPRPETIDVDLTSGDMPLRTFLEQKKPEGDVKRYLSIAYWFKNHLNTPEITMDHAYTAYRHMGWSDVPKDVAWPFREMKKTKYGWIRSGPTRGSYQINHIGESVVERLGNE
jgi:hypothetical protein